MLQKDHVDIALLVPIWPNCTRAVSGLGHYIEEEGVSTVSISLVREHTEAMRPPRALWVPFELGRPLGAPGAPEFQVDVLRAALRLFAEPEGPVLRDYPHDAPSSDAQSEPWACALPTPPLPEANSAREELVQRLQSEVALLQPWYHEGRQQSGRTAFGVSGLGVERVAEMAEFVALLASGDVPEALDGATITMPQLIRFVADDLKAFYLEAAHAQPSPRPPTAGELNHWLFGETVLGSCFYAARDALRQHDDPGLQLASRFLVPAALAAGPPFG
jgi:hypothetical protein